MKSLLTLLILFLINDSVYSQKGDSLKFYRNSLIKTNQNIYDSLIKDTAYVKLVSDYERWREKKKINVIIDGVFDLVQNDFTGINNSLGLNGLKGISSKSYRIGMGMCFEKKNKILKMNFFSIGLNQKTQNTRYKLKHQQVDLFQSSFGLLILNNERLKIFPYLGGSYRIVNLSLEESNTTENVKWTSKSHLNGVLGAEIDIRVSKIPQSKFYKYVFISFQRIFPLGNKPFDKELLDTLNYTHEGRSSLSIGLKWLITS